MLKHVALSLLLLAAGCARTPKGTVAVDFDEFSVKVRPSSATAGLIRFEQRNRGAVDHDLVVVKTELAPDELPVRKVDVDLSAKTLTVVLRDRRLGPGKTRTVPIRMQAGGYVLICNVPGHYQSGMRTSFEVR